MPNEEQNHKNPSKSYCGKCGLERSPINMCRCAGGGSGEESNKDKKTKEKDNLNLSNQIMKTSNQGVIKSTQLSNTPSWMQSKLCSDKMLNYEAGGSLFFKSDKVNGNLIFQVKSRLLDEEIKKASHESLKTIKKEFDDFKNQLAEQGIATENFTAVLKDNELRIHIPILPNPNLYDDFIKHLENKNLLSTRNQENFQPAEEDTQQAFNPSP